MSSNHLVLCCPFLLLPSIFSSTRVFSNESVLRIGWPKYWSFSFSLSPSNEYSGLISLRINWFDLLAVQGTLESLLQHHSSKASILWHSAFFQFSQFICSVMSDSLRPHESQHARPPCPSPSPGVHQTRVHRVSDAVQPSHPLSSPSPPAPDPSQHQNLFQ